MVSSGGFIKLGQKLYLGISLIFTKSGLAVVIMHKQTAHTQYMLKAHPDKSCL